MPEHDPKYKVRFEWRTKRGTEERVERRHEGGDEEAETYFHGLMEEVMRRALVRRIYMSDLEGPIAALLVAALKAETALSHLPGSPELPLGGTSQKEVREALNDLRNAFREFEPKAYRDDRDRKNEQEK